MLSDFFSFETDWLTDCFLASLIDWLTNQLTDDWLIIDWLIDLLINWYVSDYPVISRPVVRAVIKPGRRCSKVALRCYFNIRGRRNGRFIARVQWIVSKRVTKTETVRGTHAELLENTYGFKAGTTVSKVGRSLNSISHSDVYWPCRQQSSGFFTFLSKQDIVFIGLS